MTCRRFCLFFETQASEKRSLASGVVHLTLWLYFEAQVAPSGAYVASGDAGGVVKIWSLDNPEHPVKYEGQCLAGAICDIAWSPDSQVFSCQSYDRRATVAFRISERCSFSYPMCSAFVLSAMAATAWAASSCGILEGLECLCAVPRSLLPLLASFLSSSAERKASIYQRSNQSRVAQPATLIGISGAACCYSLSCLLRCCLHQHCGRNCRAQ